MHKRIYSCLAHELQHKPPGLHAITAGHEPDRLSVCEGGCIGEDGLPAESHA